jgi:hypothetical protein
MEAVEKSTDSFSAERVFWGPSLEMVARKIGYSV